jgi:membrane-bound lytic murein transglycosylase B
LLLCQLGGARRLIDDPSASAQRLAEAGQASQAAVRRLGEHPGWDAAALAALAPADREQTRLAVDAYRQLLSLAGPPSVNLPAWQVVAPQPAAALREYYQQAQQRFGVETRMGRVVGLSSAGAQGPMQFMPATWAQYGMGGNVWDTRDAIMGAANYLAANGAAKPERLDHAIERYNHDVRYVRAVRDYAAMMSADPRAFLGLHSWPVEYRTVAGPIPLPVGYRATRPIPVAQWLATHPTAPSPGTQPSGPQPPAAPPP